MPRENKSISIRYYSAVGLCESEFIEESQTDEELQMAQLFASVGVETFDLFDLKLRRQAGQIFEDGLDTFMDIEL